LIADRWNRRRGQDEEIVDDSLFIGFLLRDELPMIDQRAKELFIYRCRTNKSFSSLTLTDLGSIAESIEIVRCRRLKIIDEQTEFLLQRSAVSEALPMDDIRFDEFLQIGRIRRFGKVQSCCHEMCLI
jgi:hypothetical protein